MKTYLRSEECLNNVMLLHVRKDETDAIDLRDIARFFVSANARRMEFFDNSYNWFLHDNLFFSQLNT